MFVPLALLAALAALLAGAAPPQHAAAQGARCFPETGFCIAGPIRTYWERNGGLERFGYPLTPTIEEVLDGRVYAVQYFERRRMEEHPEYRGTPSVEGEPVGTDELPPPGKVAPVRGFGKLWRANPQLRELLGWATAPEQADAGVSAHFSGPQGLSWLVGRRGSQSVYIFRAGQPAVALEVGWQP